MLTKLQLKWKVNETQLWLILLTFAVGGTLSGKLAKLVFGLMGLHFNFIGIMMYIVLVTLIWPFCVLGVSVLTGQIGFFRRYLSTLWSKILGKKKPVRVAIFASGGGSNAKQIIETLHSYPNTMHIQIALVLTNNPNTGVLLVAQNNQIPSAIIYLKSKTECQAAAEYLAIMHQHNIDFIVLAGYLKKIPAGLIQQYPQKIINIHPALLPAYGGAGMYGIHVHNAVVAAAEKHSGITIHYVDEVYDHGKIIFQGTCELEVGETGESLSKKVLGLEHRYYTREVVGVVNKK